MQVNIINRRETICQAKPQKTGSFFHFPGSGERPCALPRPAKAAAAADTAVSAAGFLLTGRSLFPQPRGSVPLYIPQNIRFKTGKRLVMKQKICYNCTCRSIRRHSARQRSGKGSQQVVHHRSTRIPPTLSFFFFCVHFRNRMCKAMCKTGVKGAARFHAQTSVSRPVDPAASGFRPFCSVLEDFSTWSHSAKL